MPRGLIAGALALPVLLGCAGPEGAPAGQAPGATQAAMVGTPLRGVWAPDAETIRRFTQEGNGTIGVRFRDDGQAEASRVGGEVITLSPTRTRSATSAQWTANTRTRGGTSVVYFLTCPNDTGLNTISCQTRLTFPDGRNSDNGDFRLTRQ